MNKIKHIFIDVWRFPLRFFYSTKLKHKDFTLISSNCIGGGFYHDSFSEFKSPTINLVIVDFLSFCNQIPSIFEYDLVDAGIDKYGHPVAMVNNVKIIGTHYKNFEELQQKWNLRKLRIKKENIFLITTDEFLKTKELKMKFDKLSFPKICFVSQNAKYNWEILLPEFSKNGIVGDSMRYCDIFGKRINEKHFNFTKG